MKWGTCNNLTPHVTVIAFFLLNFIEYVTWPQWLLCAQPKSHVSGGNRRHPTIEHDKSPQAT